MDEPQNKQQNDQQPPAPEPQAAADPSSFAQASKDKLAACTKERDEYLNGWKRAKADLINYQRDEGKRFEEFSQFAAIELVRDFIPVLDSFAALERLEGEPRPDEASGRDLVGMRRMRSQLEDTLKRRGLERIGVSPGDPFDPARHEAVAEIESTHPPGSVAEVVEQGYALSGKLIRPARVRLAKPPASQQGTANSQ